MKRKLLLQLEEGSDLIPITAVSVKRWDAVSETLKGVVRFTIPYRDDLIVGKAKILYDGFTYIPQYRDKILDPRPGARCHEYLDVECRLGLGVEVRLPRRTAVA